jgi:protein-disulfide isomerase
MFSRFRLVCAAALVLAAFSPAVFPQTSGQQPQNSSSPNQPVGSQPAPPEAPQAPAPNQTAATTELPPMPAPNPANFTASLPTRETVESFLHETWGYDTNRVWQVEAIEKTPVQGLSKVVVFVEEKGSGQPSPTPLSFFVLPDGKHLISDDVLPFGAHPFADARNMLRSQANGPSKGAPGKDLELVEFADFECPHCKEAQPTIERLLKDFPNAHYVFENFPLIQIHSEALKASEYGICVAKQGGNAAFFRFADAVFANQAGLTPVTSTATLDQAAKAAGQDPTKVSACAATPEAKSAVKAQLQLGEDLGVNSTPMLFINGRALPFGGMPYETLKQIIEFQEELDGISATAK